MPHRFLPNADSMRSAKNTARSWSVPSNVAIASAGFDSPAAARYSSALPQASLRSPSGSTGHPPRPQTETTGESAGAPNVSSSGETSCSNLRASPGFASNAARVVLPTAILRLVPLREYQMVERGGASLSPDEPTPSKISSVFTG